MGISLMDKIERRERWLYRQRWKKEIAAERKKNRFLREQYNAKHPERLPANEAVTRAIKSGDLVRMPCAVCGYSAARSNAHHPDYSRPLEVIWLCAKHHNLLHTRLEKLFGDKNVRRAVSKCHTCPGMSGNVTA